MTVDSVLGQQVLSLVGQIRQQQSRQLGKELEKAREIARRLIRRAHGDSRLAVRRAVKRSRDTTRSADQRSRAAIATRRRIDRHHESQSLLRKAWPELEKAVCDRWSIASSRQNWWCAAIEQSARLLPKSAWVFEHAPAWPEDEQRQAAELATRLGAEHCNFHPVTDIVAGLRIRSGASCCDCTDHGLLSDRLRVEARICNELGMLRASASDAN